MKNRLIIIGGLGLIVALFVLFMKENKTNIFITETEKEIEEITIEKEKVFDMADRTLEQLELEREEKELHLEKLDLELSEKEELVKHHLYHIKKNKEISEQLEKRNQELFDLKTKLESELFKTKENLQEVIVINEKTKETLDNVYNEKEDLYNQFKELQKKYINDKLMIRDTIYKIDTVYYTSDQIKKLVLYK